MLSFLTRSGQKLDVVFFVVFCQDLDQNMMLFFVQIWTTKTTSSFLSKSGQKLDAVFFVVFCPDLDNKLDVVFVQIWTKNLMLCYKTQF
jgi:hypothetical protein